MGSSLKLPSWLPEKYELNIGNLSCCYLDPIEEEFCVVKYQSQLSPIVMALRDRKE